MPPRDLLTVAQAAERLGLNRTTVLRAITSKAKRLPAIQVGSGLWLIKRADVEAYAARRGPRLGQPGRPGSGSASARRDEERDR